MDKLTAYRLLGISQDASVEEIKEAYATLSKQYHPEENPEEFQQIHQAYVTLTRRGRRNQAVVTEIDSSLEQSSRGEMSQSDLVFRNVSQVDTSVSSDEEKPMPEFSFDRSIQRAIAQEEEELRQEQERIRLAKEKEAEKFRIKQEKLQQEKERILEEARQEEARRQEEERRQRGQFDFDASINQAEKEEQERQWQLTLQTVQELKVLFTPPNCHQPKNFKTFFGRKELQHIFFSEIFISNLAQLVNQVDLKPEVYSYLIKFYRLKDKDPQKLIVEARRLYAIIDSRYSIKNDPVEAKRRGAIGGAFGGIMFALFKYGPKIFRNVVLSDNNVDFGDALLSLMPFIILIGGGFILYKIFYKNRSTFEAQKKVACIMLLFSLVSIAFDIWAPFYPMGASDGRTIAVSTMIISVIWLLAVELCIWIVKKKREKFEQK